MKCRKKNKSVVLLAGICEKERKVGPSRRGGEEGRGSHILPRSKLRENGLDVGAVCPAPAAGNKTKRVTRKHLAVWDETDREIENGQKNV